jgi:hypothetical protein
MRVLIVAALAVLFGCDGSDPIVQPTPILPPSDQTPLWRLDRSDVVNWMVGHQPEGTGIWGGHFITPVLEGNESNGRIIFVKISPYNYEIFEYDRAFIYHREDHGGRWNGGATWGLEEAHAAYSWRNADGSKTVWSPRKVTPGFYMENEASKHHYGLGSCEVDRSFRSNLYAHVVGIEKIDVGGKIGVTETLHTFFAHPSTKGSTFDTTEHYWYSWDYGWVRWHDAKNSSTFNDPRPSPTQYEEPCIDTGYSK